MLKVANPLSSNKGVKPLSDPQHLSWTFECQIDANRPDADRVTDRWLRVTLYGFRPPIFVGLPWRTTISDPSATNAELGGLLSRLANAEPYSVAISPLKQA